jgi:hypothetical protein
VVKLTRRTDPIVNQYLADLAWKILLGRIRFDSQDGSRETLFAVVGADHLRSDDLEDLVRSAESTWTGHGYAMRLIYLFERFGTNAQALAGVGGGASGFMKLGNADDATRACNQIGRTHKVHITKSTARANAVSTGGSTGGSEGQSGYSATWGSNWGKNWNQQTTDTETDSQQIMYEFVVEPDRIQSLPDTSLIYCELQGHQRQVKDLDCHPAISTADRAALTLPGRQPRSMTPLTWKELA